MQHDYAVNAYAVGIRGPEISGEDSQGLDIGAIRVIESGCVNEIDPSTIPREIENVY